MRSSSSTVESGVAFVHIEAKACGQRDFKWALLLLRSLLLKMATHRLQPLRTSVVNVSIGHIHSGSARI